LGVKDKEMNVENMMTSENMNKETLFRLRNIEEQVEE
jgi:hypothetical protein